MISGSVNFKASAMTGAVVRAFDNDKTEAVLRAKMEVIRGMAIQIFESQARHTHPPTLPTYVSSFRIDRIRGRLGTNYVLQNTDPAAFWVEFGAYLAHPTHARILRYKPLARAIDAVGGFD